MLQPLQNAELFLVSTFFDFVLIIFMLRFLLAFVRADFYNPITQFVVKCTKRIINPLKKIIPNYRNIELSTLLIIIVLDLLKFFLISAIAVGLPKHTVGILIMAFADTFKLLLNTLFFAILLQAILSFIQQGYSPVSRVLQQVTGPLLRPFQRIMPLVGGFDLSPLPVLVILQLLIILVVEPLLQLGMGIAFG